MLCKGGGGGSGGSSDVVDESVFRRMSRVLIVEVEEEGNVAILVTGLSILPSR